MRGQDANGHTVQGTSHAQWALPDARRGEHWAPHRGRLGTFKRSQLETRPVFCKGETGREVASQVAARVQGTVPRYYGIVPVTNAAAVTSESAIGCWAPVAGKDVGRFGRQNPMQGRRNILSQRHLAFVAAHSGNDTDAARAAGYKKSRTLRSEANGDSGRPLADPNRSFQMVNHGGSITSYNPMMHNSLYLLGAANVDTPKNRFG
jgi:hypothetical protein